MGRKIYYIPMIHTERELGSLREAVVQTRERAFGKTRTAAHFRSIEDYWKSVEGRAREAGLFNPEVASKTHVFIDSLANINQTVTLELLAGDIEKGLPASLIAGELRKAGATIWGTEDPKLLVAELLYLRRLTAGKPANPAKQAERLRERDAAIIGRINSLVPDEEIAIIFIGNAHKVIDHLADDFEVVNLWKKKGGEAHV